MAGTTKSMWSYIQSNFRGEIVTPKMLFEFGKRKTVYRSLERFVERGWLIWLANGVFYCPNGSEKSLPDGSEIMNAKAQTFEKEVVQSANSAEVFNSDRGKSSFESVHGRLHFEHVGTKRFQRLKKGREDYGLPPKAALTKSAIIAEASANELVLQKKERRWLSMNSDCRRSRIITEQRFDFMSQYNRRKIKHSYTSLIC